MNGTPTHVAVVGAGAAGLYTALRSARLGARVTLISATPLAGASSYWAQGGLAAALSAADSADQHLADTLAAGRGCVRQSAAAPAKMLRQRCQCARNSVESKRSPRLFGASPPHRAAMPSSSDPQVLARFWLCSEASPAPGRTQERFSDAHDRSSNPTQGEQTSIAAG